MNKVKTKNKQKENKFGEVNYADATNAIQYENPKIKFSDLQDRIKKNTHNKKIKDILYDIPNSILSGYPFVISSNIQHNSDNKNNKKYENDKNLNEEDEEDEEEDEIINNINEDVDEMWEKYFGSRKDRMLNFVKNRKKNRFDKYYHESNSIELEEQLLDNYLYPFYHLNNNFDYDVMQKINNVSDHFVLLK
jgi:hypothetical protein